MPMFYYPSDKYFHVVIVSFFCYDNNRHQLTMIYWPGPIHFSFQINQLSLSGSQDLSDCGG